MLNRARLEKTRNCMYDSIGKHLAFPYNNQRDKNQVCENQRPRWEWQVTAKGQKESWRQ